MSSLGTEIVIDWATVRRLDTPHGKQRVADAWSTRYHFSLVPIRVGPRVQCLTSCHFLVISWKVFVWGWTDTVRRESEFPGYYLRQGCNWRQWFDWTESRGPSSKFLGCAVSFEDVGRLARFGIQSSTTTICRTGMEDTRTSDILGEFNLGLSVQIQFCFLIHCVRVLFLAADEQCRWNSCVDDDSFVNQYGFFLGYNGRKWNSWSRRVQVREEIDIWPLLYLYWRDATKMMIAQCVLN